MAESKFEATGKYNPKSPKNQQSYAEVLEVLPATLAEIKKQVPNHTDFVGYLIRRKALAEVKPAATAKRTK